LTCIVPVVHAALFQATCHNGNHGWPRFENLTDLRKSQPWASYFEQIYGELPTLSSEYPICTFDFWMINKTAFDVAGVMGHAPVETRVQAFFDDSKFNWTDGEFFEKKTDWNCAYYQGFGIYHSNRPYVGSNTWVEVVHVNAGTGSTGENVGMWFSYAPGSGIWFNTGRSRIFDNHGSASWELCGHAYKSDDDTALCARRADLDSYSFRTSRPVPAGWDCIRNYNRCKQTVSTNGTMSTWGMVNLYELVAPKLIGKFACGTEAGGASAGFRRGWRASHACNCNNANPSGWLNCASTSGDKLQDPRSAQQVVRARAFLV